MLLHTVSLVAALVAAPQTARQGEDLARFECPDPIRLDSPARGALARTLIGPPEALEDRRGLETVAGLFFQHGFTTDETVNLLISAYCPLIARETGLSREEKSSKIRAFADEAYDVASNRPPVADPGRW